MGPTTESPLKRAHWLAKNNEYGRVVLPCSCAKAILRLRAGTRKRRERGIAMGRKKTVEFDESPPDDFDPENPYKDPVAMLEMREHIVREKWIDIEKAKILREKLRWCYRIEGVNHLQKCRHLVQQYLDSTRGIGWGKDGRHPSLHGPKVEPAESE